MSFRTRARLVLAILLMALCPLAYGQLTMSQNIDRDPAQGMFHEEWMEVFSNGEKLGFGRVTLRRDGDRILTENYVRMEMKRGPVAVKVETTNTTVETVAGRPLSFESVMEIADAPIVVSGTFEDGSVRIVREQYGREYEQTHKVSDKALMYWGSILAGMDMGLEPGATISLLLYTPEVQVDRPLTARATVIGPETVGIRGERVAAVRVDSSLLATTGKVDATTYVSAGNGETLKTTMAMGGMPITVLAATEEQALSAFAPPDMFTYSLISIGREIPPDAEAVTYRVRKKPGLGNLPDIPAFPVQAVDRVDERTVRVTVKRQEIAASGARTAEPQAVYLGSSATISADDPEVVALVERALRDSPEGDDAKVVALRSFCGNFISDKSLAVGFATASEVARNPAGDCTEHAVLLAAMARAAGIPARVATGLVYVPEFLGDRNVMGFHMWTQVYLNGRWVDVDAAVGFGSGVEPIRIILNTSALAEETPAGISLSIMELIGQIDIMVESIAK